MTIRLLSIYSDVRYCIQGIIKNKDALRKYLEQKDYF